MAGSKSEVRHVPYAEGFEDMQGRVPDTGKIHKLLGLKPENGLDQIIRRVAGVRE